MLLFSQELMLAFCRLRVDVLPWKRWTALYLLDGTRSWLALCHLRLSEWDADKLLGCGQGEITWNCLLHIQEYPKKAKRQKIWSPINILFKFKRTEQWCFQYITSVAVHLEFVCIYSKLLDMFGNWCINEKFLSWCWGFNNWTIYTSLIHFLENTVKHFSFPCMFFIYRYGILIWSPCCRRTFLQHRTF